MTNRPKLSSNPQSTRSDAERRRILVIVAAVTALVVVVGIVVALGGKPSTSTGRDENVGYGTVVIEGASLPAFRSTSGDAAAGATPPLVEGVDPNGQPVSIGGGRGNQPTMVVFLAHWCPHCQRELPLLVKMMSGSDLAGLRIVALLTGTSADRPNFPPQDWLVRERWKGEVLLDDSSSSAAQSYGLSSYPYLVFLGADGKVVARASGELPAADIRALAGQSRSAA